MVESRTIEEQLAEFNKNIDDLENIGVKLEGVKLEDEDKVVILLNALPKTFEHFRDALLYGKDKLITLEEVVTSIRTKEFQKLQDSKITEEVSSGLTTIKEKREKVNGRSRSLKPRSRFDVSSVKRLVISRSTVLRKVPRTLGLLKLQMLQRRLKDMNLLGSWWLQLTIHRRVGS